MTAPPPFLPRGSFPAGPPPLPEGTIGGGRCKPDAIATASVAASGEPGLVLDARTGAGEPMTVIVRLVAEGVARVTLARPDAIPGPGRLLAKDVEQRLEKCADYDPVRKCAKISSAALSVSVALDPFRISFLDGDGSPLLAQARDEKDAVDVPTSLPFGFSRAAGRSGGAGGRSDGAGGRSDGAGDTTGPAKGAGAITAWHDSFRAAPDEHFLGFGEKFTALDKRGQQLAMWNVDAYGAHGEGSHKNVPFFVSSKGYGIFVNSTACVHFDMAASNHGAFSFVVPDDALDYFVIAGPTPKQVIARYARLVGQPTLPPEWAFGLWVSGSFRPETQDDVLARARRLRAEAIPATVIHIDCYWQKFGRWSEMLWDREAFPDPEGMIRELKALDFKVCLWMNPYLSVESDAFAEARDAGYLLKNPAGTAYVVKLWGDFHPPVGLVDFTDPKATEWFRGLLRPLLRMGVDVFKTDFGEGVPADAIATDGTAGTHLHNLYPLLYNDAVAAVTEEVTGNPGLVWARASFAGGQRHAAQWAGDPNCSFRAMASTLRAGLSLGVCGHAFWSHDIGGFHGTPDPELFVRWAQFGLLSPLSRVHGRTSRLPWEFGEEALAIFRETARLRERLMPTITASAEKSAREGLPLMRAMAIEFPDDPMTWQLDLQYMLGEDLLVAPVFERARERWVYFPAGRWVDYWTKEVVDGPGTRTVDAPLERLPLFVKEGAEIPTEEPSSSLV